jgi:hypothetical protein
MSFEIYINSNLFGRLDWMDIQPLDYKTATADESDAYTIARVRFILERDQEGYTDQSRVADLMVVLGSGYYFTAYEPRFDEPPPLSEYHCEKLCNSISKVLNSGKSNRMIVIGFEVYKKIVSDLFDGYFKIGKDLTEEDENEVGEVYE